MPQEDGSLITTGTPVSMLIENTDQRSKELTRVPSVTGPATGLHLTMSNMACATIAAADAHLHAKQRHGSPLAGWRGLVVGGVIVRSALVSDR